MKRVLSLFLTVAILCSGLSAAASNNEYITFLQNNGYIDETVSPDSAITREQAAVMIGKAMGVLRDGGNNYKNPYTDIDESQSSYTAIMSLNSLGIMTGNGDTFNPYNSISREEFAVVLERVYRFITDDIMSDADVFEGRFVDYDSISDWAQQSAANVVETGIFLADKGMRFSPKRPVTLKEASDAVYKIIKIDNKKPIFTEHESAVDPADTYEVYQKALIKPQGGIAGFGMVARFAGAPGEIYVSRKTVKPAQENRRGNPVSPVVFARVTDPDGYAIARVRLDYKETGLMEKIITINTGKPGVYQIQIINGRMDDEVAIGVNGCSSWGIRGETSFGFTETTPKESYIYVADKFENASIAASGSFSLLSEDDKAVASSSSIKRESMTNGIEISTLSTKTVYKLVFDDAFRGEFSIEGVPKLLCPTAQMAKDLKGNYIITEDGTQCHGPMQARAYNMAQKIYNDANGDFSVDVSGRPETLPENLLNPLAESYTFSNYSGFLLSAESSLDTIYLKPGPHLGEEVTLAVGRGQEQIGTAPTWEVGNYSDRPWIYGQWTGAITTNSELNWYYGEKGLIDRISIAMLYVIYSCTDDGWLTDLSNKESAGKKYATTYGNFCLGPLSNDFMRVRNYLDPEVREVIEEGMEMIADKNMNFRGQGPSNQWQFGIKLALNMWLATGEERYHDYFKRGIKGFFDPDLWPDYMGVTPAGYPIENGGCDSSYFYMNVSDYQLYHQYTKHDLADPETCEIIRDGIQKCLEFESYLNIPAPKGLAKGRPSHFTSRKEAGFSSRGGHPGWTELIDEYPLAKRMWDDFYMPVNEDGSYDTSDAAINMGHYVNSEEWAWNKLKAVYDKYDNYYGDKRTTSGPGSPYQTMVRGKFAESAPLPCEQEDQVFLNQPGIFAVKHKGVYIASFYETTLPKQSISKNSWMGGGPTLIWSEGTGAATVSTKHVGYSGTIADEDDVKSSCIYGTNNSGVLFVSGKEGAALTTDETGAYIISGIASGSSKTVTWKYELDDDGIIMTPYITPLGKDESFYVNLPISTSKNPDYKIEFEQSRLTIEYRGAKLEYSWDKDLYAELTEPEAEGDSFRRLRIKLSPEKPAAIKIKAMEE